MSEKLMQQRERLNKEVERMRQKCATIQQEFERDGGPSPEEAKLIESCLAKLETLSQKVEVHGSPATASAASASASSAKASAGSAGALPPSLPPVDRKDEDIAAEIMDKQIAILEGWQTALYNFDTTMTNSADAEASPDFQKVIVGHFADKLMGAIMEHAPGAAELDALGKAISGEYQRAAAAGASAKLRDFLIQHAKAIGKLKQKTLAERQGFISAVRAKREAIEGPGGGGKKVKLKGGGAVVTGKEVDDYGMMRMALLDTLAAVDKTLAGATPEAFFKLLSEEWIRGGKRKSHGVTVQNVVVIRLNPDYSIKDAHIQGSGGQKLAEQLLKDEPDGVDVYGLKAPRRIILLAKNGYWDAILELDAKGNDKSTGAIIEGNTTALYKYLKAKGLPKTKTLTGD
jgi:hypothetical protein